MNRSRPAPCCGRRACGRTRWRPTSACRSTRLDASGSRTISRRPIAARCSWWAISSPRPRTASRCPGVAQLAIQSGRHAAKNIRLSIDGRPRLPFRYVDKGSMATIGRHRAVAQIGRFKSSGIVAWWLWLTVHLLSLVGFRSRIAVLMEWALSYFTWQRRSRVILEVPSVPTAAAAPSLIGRVIRLDGAPHGAPGTGSPSRRPRRFRSRSPSRPRRTPRSTQSSAPLCSFGRESRVPESRSTHSRAVLGV